MRNSDIDKEKLSKMLTDVAGQFQSRLSKRDKENLAAGIQEIIHKTFFDWDPEKIREVYPLVDKIENLSSDLEWSNGGDFLDEDWRKMIRLIYELNGLPPDEEAIKRQFTT